MGDTISELMTAGAMTERPSQVPVRTRLRQVKKHIPAPLKRVMRGSTRAYGVATSRSRISPDFLIIGTKRGGTTSLWNALLEHPDVMPMFPKLREMKSPHYFDIEYGRGPAWYRSHFPPKRKRIAREAATGRRAVTGEASPYYMFHPLAAERIQNDLPEVKLIVSLRDPVERIVSHYTERFGSGTEDLSFEDALAAEEGRLAGETDRIIDEAPDYYSENHDSHSYLARGRYLEHLQPYVDRFGPDQLLILRAEDYYTDELGELQRVAGFIGIAPFPQRAGKPDHYHKLAREELKPETREWLINYYRPHVNQLEAALGRSFDWENFRDQRDGQPD